MPRRNVALTDDTAYIDASTSAVTSQNPYPNFLRHYNAEPERKWEVEIVRELMKFAQMEQGWDSYKAPPLRRDVGHFALEILHKIMRPRTPIPQVIPSSVGGIQLEWHEKGIDLELHITAPYEFEMWFRDRQNPKVQPVSMELTNDFSPLKAPIGLLTSR
jgi:hypothetical protein